MAFGIPRVERERPTRLGERLGFLSRLNVDPDERPPGLRPPGEGPHEPDEQILGLPRLSEIRQRFGERERDRAVVRVLAERPFVIPLRSRSMSKFKLSAL